jgi:hypothetical protein
MALTKPFTSCDSDAAETAKLPYPARRSGGAAISDDARRPGRAALVPGDGRQSVDGNRAVPYIYGTLRLPGHGRRDRDGVGARVPFPEGEKRRIGYSRDHRPDCVHVVVALLVAPEGLPLA